MPVVQQGVKLQEPNKRVQFESGPVGRMLGQRSGSAEQQGSKLREPNKELVQLVLQSAERTSESVEVQTETTEPESSLRSPFVLQRGGQA